MGMALPNPSFDEQFRTSTLQAEKALPPEYIRTLERNRSPILPRLHLWGLSGRWVSLPMFLRRILAAVMVLTFMGAFTATAHIQARAAMAELERTSYSNARFEDDLAEVSAFNRSDFIIQSEGIGKVAD